jgi:BON domain
MGFLAGCTAKPNTGGHVVSTRVAPIRPDLDKGIERSLDAALIQGGLHNDINYAVKDQVITMTGELDSQLQRTQAQDIAAAIPNVQQVVNELRLKEPAPVEEPIAAR